jgi:hypothetical protein
MIAAIISSATRYIATMSMSIVEGGRFYGRTVSNRICQDPVFWTVPYAASIPTSLRWSACDDNWEWSVLLVANILYSTLTNPASYLDISMNIR